MQCLWVIQDSNGKHYNWTELYKAAFSVGSNAVYVPIDFVSEYKVEKNTHPIVIGGDDYLNCANKNVDLKNGIFIAPVFFNVPNYMRLWQKKYLNWDTRFINSADVSNIECPFFIRPMHDDKYIDGQVIESNKKISYLQSLFVKEQNHILCVSSVKKLSREWRAVIVQNKVVAVCRYAKNAISAVSAIDVPTHVMSFIQVNCQIKNAPNAWVMDVAEYHDELFVLECNIFNASNFYDCDRLTIIKAVEKSLNKK